MTRKGSRKVRTGCRTCKVRRVKCDEGKPSCLRCTSTGRTCDGYAEPASPPAPGVLWYRPRAAFQGVDDAAELRALHVFTELLSPVLSGPLDPYFWTHLVMQFSHFEPAVRHSLVAISSLYTQHTPIGTNRPRLLDNSFALHHYNAAIRELRVLNNEPLVLLVCILFTCIEFLQGNAVAAGAHCKHGTIILNHVEKAYPWAKQYLSPIFRRINVMPFFFGQPDFPRMTGLDEPIPDDFVDLSQAQLHLDGIINRSIHLLRYGMMYRVQVPNYTSLPVAPHIIDEQIDLMRRLRQWQAAFALLRAQSSDMPASKTNATTYAYMTILSGIARIWVESTLKDDETMFDNYIPLFRHLVEEAAQIELLEHNNNNDSDHDDSTMRPKFTFEMGFTPSIFFIVLKCRCLVTRIRALSLLRSLGVARENMWDSAAIYSTAKRVIELEHQIKLDDDDDDDGNDGTPPPGGRGKDLAASAWRTNKELPPDERRIRTIDSSPDLVMRVDEETGQRVYERKMAFYYEVPGGGLYMHHEMLREVPRRWR